MVNLIPSVQTAILKPFIAKALVTKTWITNVGSMMVVATLAVGLGSCGGSTPPEESEAQSVAPQETGITIVTTFLPITEFTQAVAGDRAAVTQLLPMNVDPHDFQAKPADVQALAQADILVKNGLEMENFLEDLVANANNANLRVIDTSAGVATIENDDIAPGHQGHDHGHNHDHENEPSQGTGHHHHGKYNPHIWLDPKRAIQQVENIRDGLISVDGDNEAIYTANAAAYIQQLQELDREISAQLRPFSGRTFVVFHDFAPYFAQSYNLNAEFLVDVPEDNPSPADVQRVMNIVQRTDLKTLLTEPGAGASFAALAQDLGVNISTFDPLETGAADAVQPGYYITTMRQNVQNILTAFGGKTQQSYLPLWPAQSVAVVPQGLFF